MNPSKSNYASPSHMVPKKSFDDWHSVDDYRALNAQTKKDKYPIPSMIDFTSEFHKIAIFSHTDLVKTFHKIAIFSHIDLVKTFHEIAIAPKNIHNCYLYTLWTLREHSDAIRYVQRI